MGDWNNSIKVLKDCSSENIIYLLNNVVIKDPSSPSYKYKATILEYIKEANIDGTKILLLFKKQLFVPNLKTYINPSNNKLNSILKNLKQNILKMNLAIIKKTNAQPNPSSMATGLDRIERGLAKYYTSQGASYDGEFKDYYDENGFEMDDLDDEMQLSDIDDCSILDFDDDFPIPANITDDYAKQQHIFKILKDCYDPNKQFDVSKIRLSKNQINKKIVKQTKSQLQKQTPKIYKDVKNEEDVMYFLSARNVNNGYSFLTNVVDAFNRDRITAKFNGKDPPTVVEWIASNPFTKALSRKEKKLSEKLSNGIKGYTNRISPALQFAPLSGITDKIEDVANYIVVTSNFIKNLMAKQNAKVPFQVDLSIAVKGVSDQSGDAKNGDNDDDDDFDDDDDDDDDDYDDDSDDDDDDNKNNKAKKDFIGSVQAKLSSSNLGFTDEPIDDQKTIEGLQRFMNKNYKDFKDKLASNPKKNFNKNIAPHHTAFDASTYPTRKRFGIFVDRRDVKDKMVFFEPPYICDTMPKHDHLTEWFFESVRTCIIPKMNFDAAASDHDSDPDDDDYDDKDPDDVTITSQSAIGGSLITFSFHVEAENIIKCYMYWMGQAMRFYPQDIVQAFQYVFTKEKYDEFMNSKKYNTIIPKIHIKDIEFERFYKHMHYNIDFPKTNFN